MEIDNTIEKGSRDESKHDVLYLLRSNLYGCDMLLCLFVAALQSSKADKCLRPFPPMYINSFQKDIEGLKELCNKFPPLHNILENADLYSKEIFDLLGWLFCTGGHPQLQLTNYNIVSVPNKIQKYLQPHYTFEVIYSFKNEVLWQKRKGTFNTFLAYHGSPVQNFYSILRVGLQQNISDRSELLYGTGIYLTTEVMISMPYAPFGFTWNKSRLGKKHSIIAVCEVIDNVDKVKCKGQITNDNGIFRNMPDKYFVVTDSDAVRLKYLFIYKENITTNSWIYNLIIILIFTYILILYCNGFFQGPMWNKLQKHFYELVVDKFSTKD